MGIFALFTPQIPRLEWRGHTEGQVNVMSHSVIHQMGMKGDSVKIVNQQRTHFAFCWQPCFIIVCCRDEGKYVKPTSNSSKTSKNRLQKSVRSSHSPSSSPHLSEGRRDKHSRSRSPQSSKYIRRYVDMLKSLDKKD